ncbi:hypothetical protein LshimejAT787_0102890 [Lyophyllum shimeji]|uniref:F-box domain-containing protein n=1 Tax=Lyophyllum shimeji TaxID=47721 RepID=A0A9P3PCI2_LYOSH|nr:hypothetical protein LshimejAT787_0102890 [Lyophyllum shimeji]
MPFHESPLISLSFHRNGQPRARVFKGRSEYNKICFAGLKYHTSQEKSSPRNPYFDRLPLELKVQIFAECLASYPSLSAKEAPLLLCHVSASWRVIVQSTPKLWARFNLNAPNFDALNATHHQRIMNALNVWLHRSRGSELSFRISHNTTGSSPDPRSAHLLAALIPHAHRWKDVDLHVPSSSIEPAQNSSLGALPALRSVTLNMQGLWHPRVPFDVQALGIPWRQLTTLNLHFDCNQLLTLDKCLDILSHCGMLSRCSMNVDCAFATPGHLPGRVVLPILTHFDLMLHRGEQTGITDRAESCLVTFLEGLELPQLQSLALHWLVSSEDGSGHWLEVHRRFLTMLGRVAPFLKSLTLAYLPLTDVAVLESLAQLQSLSRLDLRFSLADREHDPITDAFFSACILRPDDPSPAILPLLESVYLQCYGARYTGKHVADFVRSRRMHIQSDVKLRSFTLVSMKPVAAHARRILEQWSEEGLEVSIDQVDIR